MFLMRAARWRFAAALVVVRRSEAPFIVSITTAKVRVLAALCTPRDHHLLHRQRLRADVGTDCARTTTAARTRSVSAHGTDRDLLLHQWPRCAAPQRSGAIGTTAPATDTSQPKQIMPLPGKLGARCGERSTAVPSTPAVVDVARPYPSVIEGRPRTCSWCTLRRRPSLN